MTVYLVNSTKATFSKLASYIKIFGSSLQDMVWKNCRLSFNLQNLWKNAHIQIAHIKTHNKTLSKTNLKTSSISKEN
jgi:hypothetical protein